MEVPKLPDPLFDGVRNGAPKSQEQVMNMWKDIVSNLSMQRSAFFQQFLDPRRNIDNECGYPNLTSFAGEQYFDLFDRMAIAARVVQLMPKECWLVQPTVYEDEDAETQTEFEKAWDSLDENLHHGTQNFFKPEEGSTVWEYLARIDELAGIGSFGVLLLGLDDGQTLDTPVQGVIPPNVQNSRVQGVTWVAKGDETGKKYDENNWITENRRHQDLAPLEERNQYIRNKVNEKLLRDSNQVGREFEQPEGSALQQDGTPKDITGVSSSSDVGDVSKDIYGGQLPPNFLDATQLAGVKGTDLLYLPLQFTPLTPPMQEKPKGPRKLIFLRPYPEHQVQVVQYEADIRNPRFGQPVMYLIVLNDPRQPHTGVGLPLASVRVHWTRVIHVADNLTSSEVFGVPRMRPVLNEILDIKKVKGAGAEGYWKSCFTGISLETHPQLGGDVTVDRQGLKDMVESYDQGLQRWISLMGMTAKTLAPTVVDPTPHIDKALEAICIKLGCPLRVFKGAERGELASSQDDEDWNQRVKGRRLFFCTPKIIVPFVNRLIAIGVLPVPKDGYNVQWPESEALGKKDKAAIALQLTQAITAFASGGGENVMPLLDYYVHILEMDEDVAQQLVDDAKEELEQKQDEQTKLAQEHGQVPQIPGFQPDPANTPQKLGPGESLVNPPKPGDTEGVHSPHTPPAQVVAPVAPKAPPGAKGGAEPPEAPEQPEKPTKNTMIIFNRVCDAMGLTPEERIDAYLALNFNPNHDEHGRFASGEGGHGGGHGTKVGARALTAAATVDVPGAHHAELVHVALDAIKFLGKQAETHLGEGSRVAKVAEKIGHYEHAVVQGVKDTFEKGVSKLPPALQAPVRFGVSIGQGALAIAFAGYTAGQAFSERVARERGETPERAAQIRGTLGKIDLITFEGFKVAALAGFHPAHAGALITGLVPVASASYLAMSTATKPSATLRAAKGVIKDGIAGLGRLGKAALEHVDTTTLGFVGATHNIEGVEANAMKLVDAMYAHKWCDWYNALLSVAIDEVGNGDRAIELANRMYELFPKDTAYPHSDDDEAVLNQFCATGPGGGIDATCSPKGAAGGKALAGMARDALTGADKKTYDAIREKVLSETKAKRGGLGVAGLKAMAKELGIKKYTTLKKDDLIKAVHDKLNIEERAHGEKSEVASKADRMYRVNLAAEHSGVAFNDRVVNGVMARNGEMEKPEYKEAVQDVMQNGVNAKSSSHQYLKAIHNNTLNDIINGDVKHETLSNVLKDLSAQNHGTMSVDEFRKQEHQDYLHKDMKTGETRHYAPITPKEKEVGLAPPEKGTLWKTPPKKDLGYIERIDKPAFERLQEVTKAEKDTGKKFKDKVLDELLNDTKVKVKLDPDDTAKYQELQEKHKLSQADTRFIKGFRDQLQSLVRQGKISDLQTVDALERLSDKGHGTMRLDEYHSLVGGEHVEPGLPKETEAPKKSTRGGAAKVLSSDTIERIKKELGPELAKSVLKGTKEGDAEAEARVKSELPKEYWNKVLDKPSKGEKKAKAEKPKGRSVLKPDPDNPGKYIETVVPKEKKGRKK